MSWLLILGAFASGVLAGFFLTCVAVISDCGETEKEAIYHEGYRKGLEDAKHER